VLRPQALGLPIQGRRRGGLQAIPRRFFARAMWRGRCNCRRGGLADFALALPYPASESFHSSRRGRAAVHARGTASGGGIGRRSSVHPRPSVPAEACSGGGSMLLLRQGASMVERVFLVVVELAEALVG
jgi:hypothetical protein